MRTVLIVELSPQRQVTRRVYTSVRAGWWVVCNTGGSGTFSVACQLRRYFQLVDRLFVGDGQPEAGFTIGDKRSRGPVASGGRR